MVIEYPLNKSSFKKHASSKIIVGVLVCFLLLMGLLSVFLLSKVNQDVRQQASGNSDLYKVGDPCSTEGTVECDATNKGVTCAGGQWRSGGSCSITEKEQISNTTSEETPAVTQPDTALIAGACYYGVSSCSSLGRETASNCSSCPVGTASCCGKTFEELTAAFGGPGPICEPFTSRCEEDSVVVCSVDGSQEVITNCEFGCNEGACLSQQCTPNECDDSGYQCNQFGRLTTIICELNTVENAQFCSVAGQCIDGKRCLPSDIQQNNVASGGNCNTPISQEVQVNIDQPIESTEIEANTAEVTVQVCNQSTAGKCVEGILCGNDGVFTSIACDTGVACDDGTPDNGHNPLGDKCINGDFYPDPTYEVDLHCEPGSCVATYWCDGGEISPFLRCNTGQNCSGAYEGDCNAARQRCLGGKFYPDDFCAVEKAKESVCTFPSECVDGRQCLSSDLGKTPTGATCTGFDVNQTTGYVTVSSQTFTNCSPKQSCVDGKWCDSNGNLLAVSCESSCEEVAEGRCNNNGQQCLRGALVDSPSCEVFPPEVVENATTLFNQVTVFLKDTFSQTCSEIERSCIGQGMTCVADFDGYNARCTTPPAGYSGNVEYYPCQIANTCIEGIWCSRDLTFTSIACNTGKKCGSIADNSCSKDGKRCINGHLWAGNGCSETGEDLVPENKSSCLYGVSSCSIVGRYDSNNCANCPSGTASCCGAVLANSISCDRPNTVTCQNNKVISCSWDGKVEAQRSCQSGYECLNGECVANQARVDTSCSCTATVFGQTQSISVNSSIVNEVGDCYQCIPYNSVNGSSCGLIDRCNIREVSSSADDGQVISSEKDRIEAEYGITLLGGGSNFSTEDLRELEKVLKLLPASFYENATIILDTQNLQSGASGSAWGRYGDGIVTIKLADCDRPAQGNPNLDCGFRTDTSIHEIIHLNDPSTSNTQGNTTFFDRETMEQSFIEAAANDGMTFYTEVTTTHKESDSLMISYSGVAEIPVHEGFAEAATDYVLYPEQLQRDFPNVYEVMKNEMYDGVEYMTFITEFCREEIRIRSIENESLSNQHLRDCS